MDSRRNSLLDISVGNELARLCFLLGLAFFGFPFWEAKAQLSGATDLIEKRQLSGASQVTFSSDGQKVQQPTEELKGLDTSQLSDKKLQVIQQLSDSFSNISKEDQEKLLRELQQLKKMIDARNKSMESISK